MTRRLVACLCFALAASLPAASARAGAKEDVAEATRLLENVEEEKAVPVLERAVADAGAAPAELAEAWSLLGVARFNLRNEAGAREAFRKALDANPALSVSKLLAPKGRALVEEVRAQREEELKAKASQAAVEPPKVIVIEKPAEPLLTTREIAGVGVGGAGLAALAVGAGLAASAYSLRDQAVSEPDANKADQLFRSGKTQRTAGLTMLGVGTAVLAAGVALFFWPETAGTKVVVAPNGVAVAGRF